MTESLKRPNILYIHTHDIGRYVQPHGYAVPTPNIQKLAEQGVLFRQTFCANPTCSASRASLLTGMYPHNNGMTGLAHRGWSLNDYSQHIVHTLKSAGYVTLCREPSMWSVMRTVMRGRSLDMITILEIKMKPRTGLWSYLESDPTEPFFLSVGFADTHREFEPLNGIDDPRYCRPPDPIPDTPETREDMARFKASCTHAGYEDG